MSGTTRSVQQPLESRNLLAAIGMATAVLAATVAIVWSSANLGRTAPAALPAPAPIVLPVDRDLGARDLGAASVSVGATHGAPGAYRPAIGSLPGFLADKPPTSSGADAPAIRHPGLRAQ